MVIFLSTYKPRGSHINLPMNKIHHQSIHYVIIGDTLYHWGIIQSFNVAYFMKSWEFFLMIVIVDLVVVIYLDLLQRKKIV